MNTKSICSIFAACLAGLFVAPANADTFTWSGASGGNWSNPANWNPNSAYPSTNDTAVIPDASAGQTIYYDASASGALDALSFTQTTTGTNTLRILRAGASASTPSLLLTNNLTLGGGTPTKVTEIYIDPSQNQAGAAGANMYLDLGSTAGSGIMTINAGGLLTLGGYWYSGSNTVYTSNVQGSLNISGGTVQMNLPVGTDTSAYHYIDNTINGNVSMSSGAITLKWVEYAVNRVTNRLIINGDYTQTGGSLDLGKYPAAIINGNFSVTGGTIYVYGNTINTGLILHGTTNTIGGTASQTSPSTQNSYYTLVNQAGTATQSLSTSLQIGKLQLLGVDAGNSIKNVSSSYAGANTQVNGAIELRQTVANGTTTLKLGSNLSAGSITGFTQASIVNHVVDLDGHVLTSKNNFAPINIGTNQKINWSISNSASGTGVLSAPAFDFSGGTYGVNRVSVGSGVVLMSTGTAANNLGSSTIGTISADSTFLYKGTGATLTSGRTIGRLAVGDGTNASTLSLATAALSVGGDITVNSNGVLDLAGQNLTQTAIGGGTTGGLSGSGTISNNIVGTVMLTLDTTNSNGNFSGAITTGTGEVAVTKNGSGTQTFTGPNTYAGGTIVSVGTLLVDNTSGSGTGTGTVAVSGGAILGGTGTTSGAVTASAASSVFAPGDANTIGTLHLTGGLTAESGATFNIDINGGSNDKIAFGSGGLTLGATVTFNFANLGTITGYTPYTLFTGTGAWTGTPIFVFNTVPGYGLDSSYGTGGYIWDPASDQLTVQLVPEPSIWALLAFSLTTVMVLRRRRKS